MMGIGASVLLMAAGAILSIAVGVPPTDGANIHTVGYVLAGLGSLCFLAVLVMGEVSERGAHVAAATDHRRHRRHIRGRSIA